MRARPIAVREEATYFLRRIRNEGAHVYIYIHRKSGLSRGTVTLRSSYIRIVVRCIKILSRRPDSGNRLTFFSRKRAFIDMNIPAPWDWETFSFTFINRKRHEFDWKFGDTLAFTNAPSDSDSDSESWSREREKAGTTYGDRFHRV